MVKITIVGRVSDGLPLSQSPHRYLDEENESSLFYKQQGELILKEIARGALTASKMSILIDHHCFQKLAFSYLQDLHKEFQTVDTERVETISKPYGFTRSDSIIGNVKKQYMDTRTQVNLSKLNANRRQDLDIVTQDFSEIIENRRKSENTERVTSIPRSHSTIWSSQYLEVIALKWTPITILVVVAALFLWTAFIGTNYYVTTAF